LPQTLPRLAMRQALVELGYGGLTPPRP
jgi:hypothetical protein